MSGPKLQSADVSVTGQIGGTKGVGGVGVQNDGRSVDTLVAKE